MKSHEQKTVGHTAGPILFEGWFPPREHGLIPSVKAQWDGRMLQLFSDNLEQAEIDMKLLSQAPAMLEALELVLMTLRQYDIGHERQAEISAIIARAKGEA